MKRELLQKQKEESEINLEVTRRENEVKKEEKRLQDTKNQLKEIKDQMVANQTSLSSLDNEND